MTDLVNEQLSAFLDGELPPEETALLLRRLQREPELADRLERYRLYGDVFRGQASGVSHRLSQRIHDGVALEPALARMRVSPTRRDEWRRAFGGLAVAASVAVLSVWLVQHGGTSQSQLVASQPSTGSARSTMAAPATRAASPTVLVASARDAGVMNKEPVSYVTPSGRTSLQTIPEAELARYVVAHSEVSTPLSSRDVLIHLVADAPSQDGQ